MSLEFQIKQTVIPLFLLSFCFPLFSLFFYIPANNTFKAVIEIQTETT